HDAQHLPAHQIGGRVMHGDLRRGSPLADLRAEIDPELQRGLLRLGEGLGAGDGADADVDLEEVVEGDGHWSSSLARAAAAATARGRSAGKPVSASISTLSAASVVPPGLVTFSRSVPG